jgi:hypothetical protein
LLIWVANINYSVSLRLLICIIIISVIHGDSLVITDRTWGTSIPWVLVVDVLLCELDVDADVSLFELGGGEVDEVVEVVVDEVVPDEEPGMNDNEDRSHESSADEEPGDD